jgi:hypothetical protein
MMSRIRGAASPQYGTPDTIDLSKRENDWLQTCSGTPVVWNDRVRRELLVDQFLELRENVTFALVTLGRF